MINLTGTQSLGVLPLPGNSKVPSDVYVSYVAATGTTLTSHQASVTTTISQTTILTNSVDTTQVKYVSVFNNTGSVQNLTMYVTSGVAEAGPTDYTGAYDPNSVSNTIVGGDFTVLADLSGNGRDFTPPSSGPTQVLDTLSSGLSRNVMNFNGITDWLESAVDYTTFVSASAWTVIAEVKPTVTPVMSQNVFLNQASAATGDTVDGAFAGGLVFRHNTLTLKNEVGSGLVIITDDIDDTAWTSGYNINEWQILTGRQDGANPSIQMYPKAPVLGPAMHHAGDTGTPGTMAIGRANIVGSSFFTGNIGRIRYWNRALTQAEINSTAREYLGYTVQTTLYSATLAPGEMLQYADGEGWSVFDRYGNRKMRQLNATNGIKYFENYQPRTATSAPMGSLFLQRAVLPKSMAPDVAMMQLICNVSGNGQNTVSVLFGAYQFSSNSIFLKQSAMRNIWIGSNGDVFSSTDSASGTKRWSIPLDRWTLPAGDYMFGFAIGTDALAGTSGTYSYYFNRFLNNGNAFSINGTEFDGGGSNLTTPLIFGIFNSSINVRVGLPPSIAWSQVNQTGAGQFAQQPWFIMAQTNQTS